MNPIISLSTSNLQRRFGDDGYAMLQKAAQLGFEYVEIGHSTPVSAVRGILKAVDEGVVKVSSVHNFCPLPPFVRGAAPNLYSPATKSKLESEQWTRHTLVSLEFARRVGARALVCHTGRLSYFFRRPEWRVAKFLEGKDYAALAQNPKYAAAVSRFLEGAKARARGDYGAIFSNFAAVAGVAGESQVELCVENRESPADIPLESDFPEFMEKFAAMPIVRAWHDVGHSMIKQLSGFGSQLDFAQSILPYQAGWHLHDCDESGRDHIAIGAGAIDFRALSKFFNPQKHIFTLELSASVGEAAAADSLKRVRDLMP